MKKTVYLSGFLVLLLSIISCSKIDVEKDVNLSIAKLNQFNNQFNEFYTDGIISKDTLQNQKSSEFDQLKKFASEYYEVINKINAQIEEEKEAASKGKKVDGYEDAYVKSIETLEVEKATSLFIENLGKIDNENITDTIVNSEELIIENDTIIN
jgi:hypothetical protein